MANDNTAPKKVFVRYSGWASERSFSKEDIKKLGVEGDIGKTTFKKGNPIEVDENLANTLEKKYPKEFAVVQL